MLEELEFKDLEAQDNLKASGEELNPNVKTEELLLVAKDILKNLLEVYPDSKVIHQKYLIFYKLMTIPMSGPELVALTFNLPASTHLG